VNLKKTHDIPGRTGKGDAMVGVMIAMGSSSSSSGEMVSSDCSTSAICDNYAHSSTYQRLLSRLSIRGLASTINCDEWG
jgi:hypothetical protein